MGENGGAKESPKPPSKAELEEGLWKKVTEGKIKELQKFLDNEETVQRLDINCQHQEFDEDGSNIVIHCLKGSRNRGASFGRDHGACLKLLVEKGADVNFQDKGGRTALFWAVTHKYTSYIHRLVELGARPDVFNQDGVSPFHAAVSMGLKDCVQLFTQGENKTLSNLADEKGVPPIVSAARDGRGEVCVLLLEKGADINAVERSTNRSAVYYAIKNKHLDILDVLLKHEPDLATVDSEGKTILFLVSETSDVRLFHRVLQHLPHFPPSLVDKMSEDGKTAVIVACQNGNAEQLKHLLDEKASARTQDEAGKTALHYCADNLETQCAEMLLAADPSIIDVSDEQGYTALALAVLAGNNNLLRLLLDKDSDINCVDNEGHKLAHWAAVCGHLKILDILIEHKADLSSPDNHKAYPIHYAAQMNGQNSGSSDSKIAEKVLKRILDCNVPMDVVDDAGRQPLLWAACSGNSESCKLLLKAGADVNSRDGDGLTALHCAASRGHHECIEVLRKHKADGNLVDRNKCTPLFYAITLGNKQCTKALLNAGADPNHVDDRGRNPVHCAAIKGCLETVKLLEKEKADLWKQNNKGDYPVHEAAQKGHLDVVKYLLRQRNDKDAVNVQNNAGKTLLHIASATNNLPLCKLLMNHDCEKNSLMRHADKEFTPYDLAVLKGYKATADYLKNKGALPYSDLNNQERRESKSARSRKKLSIAPLPEEKEEKDKRRKSSTPGVKSPEKSRTPTPKREGKSPTASKGTVVKAGVAARAVSASKRSSPRPKSAASSKKDQKSPSPSKTPTTSPTKTRTPSPTKTPTPVPIPAVSPADSGKKTEDKDGKKSAGKESPKASDDKQATKSPDGSGKGEVTKETADKAVGKEIVTVAVMTEPEKKEKEVKKETAKVGKVSRQKSSESLVSKEDGIRSSKESLVEVETPIESRNRDASTQMDTIPLVTTGTQKGVTSPMGSAATRPARDLKKDQYESKVEPEQVQENGMPSKEGTAKSKAPTDRDRTPFSDDEDYESSKPKSRRKQTSTPHTGGKNMTKVVGSIRDSVKQYQNRRSQSRQLHQLKRAQIYTGPMHDILMFSKLMDTYRRGGLTADEEDPDVRPQASWDGYLQDQLKFVSHLYEEDKPELRPISATAKTRSSTMSKATSKATKTESKHHMRLKQEANQRKQDSEYRYLDMRHRVERQRKKRADMDLEMEKLAQKTSKMFDSVNTDADDSLRSAKTRNSQLKELHVKPKEEISRPATDMREGEEEKAEEREVLDPAKERKEKLKNWHKRKDEEMRRRLLQAYRPYFPDDVFHSKQVCISGGRVKSAGRLRIDTSPSRRKPNSSPRPSSHKSDSTFSTAQYKLRENTQVQMTPYGLRRVRNQDRPTYDDAMDDLADAIFFSRSSRTSSADVAANWSRKYDGNIRPRTGLVFVEPRVYDEMLREERESKDRITAEGRHQQFKLAVNTYRKDTSMQNGHVPNGDAKES